jgi:hypothetical protein
MTREDCNRTRVARKRRFMSEKWFRCFPTRFLEGRYR